MAILSGNTQIAPAGEVLPAPLVVQVRDLQGVPLAGADVYFTPSSGASVSHSGPVIADANGFAQTTVRAPLGGGEFGVSAASPSSVSSVAFSLFSRRLDVGVNGQNLTLSIDNRTFAPNPQVPYIVMLSFPGSPTLPTTVGPLCIDPRYALALVIEDGTGAFGNVSFSGAGGFGNPGLSRSYPVPSGLFTGQLMRFQALGFDAVDGWFRTNCETYQF
jgi:hypothetical protein